MATTLITGRDLTLTINSVAYDAQTSSCTLAVENNQQVIEAFDARHYKTVDRTATLSVELFADWGAATSICEALWDAAKASPDTALTFTFVANTTTYSGSCYPAPPAIGGGATDIMTTTVELVVDQGTVTATS
jgi:hypothetical protein